MEGGLLKVYLMAFCIVILIMVQVNNPSIASIDKIPVAITFNADVWGAQEELISILNLLDKYHIRSTFFFLGKYAELEPNALRLVFNEGHEIGARSYDHTCRLIDMSIDEQKADINRTVNLIFNAIRQRPIGFAAPGYFYNNETLYVLKELGFMYDRSARGTLHTPNDEPYWIWQNEAKMGIKYIGVFSNQCPLIHEQGIYEFPITYSLNYSPFNITSGISPIWWEKINGTDIMLSDATWFEELQWNQSRCLDVLKYGLNQQIEFGTPLIVSFAPHIIGKAEWIWILKEFINAALKTNKVIFLTLNELMNWWFNGSCLRIVKETSKQTVSLKENFKVLIHLYILRGEIYNVTVTDEFNGILLDVNPKGQVIENKLIWHFNKLNHNFTISYVMIPSYLTFLSPKITFKHTTISRELFISPTLLNSESLMHSIRSNAVKLYVQMNPIIFWSMVIFVTVLIIFLVFKIYKKIKLIQEKSWAYSKPLFIISLKERNIIRTKHMIASKIYIGSKFKIGCLNLFSRYIK